MASLYSNENFPFPVVQDLRRLGHDVLTILESARSDQALPDAAVLAFAHQSNRALLTLNRKHFLKLHNEGHPHAGMILCTFDRDFLQQAASIHSAISQMPSLSGQVIRINRPNP